MDFGQAQGQVKQAGQEGQNAINAFNPTDVAGRQQGQFSQLAGSQLGGGPQNASDYMNLYSQQVAKNPTVTGLYNTANQMFNVPQQAQQASYLQNQVNQVAPNQYSLARGFDVGNAQVQNSINNQLQFLQPEANAATNNAQTAQNLANQYVQAGIQQNQQNLLPVQSYQPILQQALAAQATGFTQAAQNEFAGLQAKMQSGVQLSQQEMQQYTQLAQAQAQYQASLAQAQAGITEANIGQQYKTLNPAQQVYNVNTGQNYTYGG